MLDMATDNQVSAVQPAQTYSAEEARVSVPSTDGKVPAPSETTGEAAESLAVDMEVPLELAAKKQEFQELVRAGRMDAGTARATLDALVKEYNTKESAELVEAKAHLSHKAEIAHAHAELYKFDALYRAQTDAIGIGGDIRVSGADERQKQADDLAGRYGITTEHDDEVAEARKKYEAARRNNANDPEAARAAELEWHRLRMLQTHDREQRLRDAGHPDAAGRMRDHGRTINKDFTDAMDAYDQQTKALRDAKRRALENEKGFMTAAEQEEFKKFDGMLNAEREGLLGRVNAQAAKDAAELRGTELQNLLGAKEEAPPPYLHQQRFATAKASAGDNHTPSPINRDTSPSSNVMGV